MVANATFEDHPTDQDKIIMRKERRCTSCGGDCKKSGCERADEKRGWIGLDFKDMPEIYFGDIAFLHGARWAEAKLKEKNGALDNR